MVSSAISGVTLHLLQASAANTPTTLTISPDTSAAQTSISAFVTALNGAISSIQSLTGYDPSTQTAGALNGNATLESFQNQLQNVLDKVTSGGVGGVKSLADLGITANTNGSYDVNTTTLGNALSSSLTSVESLLSGLNGIATQLNTLINGYTQPGGLLDTINQGLQSSLSSVSKQQQALTAQLATYSATLTSEYNAMDTAIAQLKQTQTYLTAEFNPNQATSSELLEQQFGQRQPEHLRRRRHDAIATRGGALPRGAAATAPSPTRARLGWCRSCSSTSCRSLRPRRVAWSGFRRICR